jgi:hypothetical protein
MIETREDAYRLLAELGAPERLLLHVRLVGEAADRLIEEYTTLGLRFDARLIRLGVAVHDAGKISFPAELEGPGSMHEPAGEALMLANGVQPGIARCCVTHATWHGDEVTFEERSIALADKLWKGKREASLELAVIDGAAAQLEVDRWDVFSQLDEVFEQIASGGLARLERSRAG